MKRVESNMPIEYLHRVEERTQAMLVPLPATLSAKIPEGYAPAGEANPVVALHMPVPLRWFAKEEIGSSPGRITVQRTTLTRIATELPQAKIKVSEVSQFKTRHSIAAGITASEVAGIPTFYANRGQRTEPLPINGVWEHLDSLREEYRVTSEDVKEFGRSPLALKGLKAATVNLTIIGLKGLSAREKMSRLRAATKALDIKPNEANGPRPRNLHRGRRGGDQEDKGHHQPPRPSGQAGGVTVPRCATCAHPDRADIDRRLVSGEPERAIASRYGLSRASVQRHHKNHLPDTLTKATEAAEITRADDLLAQVRKQVEELRVLFGAAVKILRDARLEHDHDSALKAVGAATRTHSAALRHLELLAKLAGELQEGPQVGVVIASPDWLALRSAILDALESQPQAREAVLRAMRRAADAG